MPAFTFLKKLLGSYRELVILNYALVKIQVLLEGYPKLLNLEFPVLETFYGLLDTELDGPNGISHVVDYHDVKNPIRVYLRAKLVYFPLKDRDL